MVAGMSRKRQDLDKTEYVMKALTDGELHCDQIVTCILKNGTINNNQGCYCEVAHV